jgi:hypothetical protein
VVAGNILDFFLYLNPCIGTFDSITKKRVEQADEKQVGKEMLHGSAILNT